MVVVFPLGAALLAGLISSGIWSIRAGELVIPALAATCALTGVVLLFIARLPLYRQGRFFTTGPRLLDASHRQIYRWSYRFLTVGALLMIFILAALR
jgi:hypothetical protein